MQLRQYLQQLKGTATLDVFQRDILAIKAKLEGDFELASGAYQSQISQAPSNPIPHLLLGKLYLDHNRLKEAEGEFKKADLLIELNPAFSTPYLPIQMAVLSEKKKRLNSKERYLNKAILAAKENLPASIYLSRVFKKMGDKKREALILKRIDRLKKSEAAKNAEEKS
mgnify:CR=1 FL=1